jgi:flagellar basal body-associated protein FliL
MNLIDENFEEKKIKEDKNKKIAKIILILMGVILVVIIGLIGAMAYIKSSELQVYLNGSANPKIKEMMVIEDDGTIYFPIKEIASYLGYKSYNGG